MNELKILEYIKKNKLDSINVLRVLDRLIKTPAISFTYEDIKIDLRPQTSESRITEALRTLSKAGILEDSRKFSGRPPKYLDKTIGLEVNKGQNGRYKLILKSRTFKIMFHIYYYSEDKESVKQFLSSPLTDKVIENHGTSLIYDIIKPYLEISEFKRMASNIVLNSDLTKNEYNKHAKELKNIILNDQNRSDDIKETIDDEFELINHLKRIGADVLPREIESIIMLREFEPLEAVRFCRERLHHSLAKAYNELAKRSVITQGLANFLVFDNYLSPLSAHPVNSIKKILFSKPFERIYEDAYLLDGEAFWVLSGRASAIYNSFSDFLYEYFKKESYLEEERKIITREMIYSWNVASTRFDIICSALADLYQKKAGSGNYHLKSDGLDYSITDLGSGESLLPPEIGSSLLVFGSTPRTIESDPQESKRMVVEVMEEPFAILRPCYIFKDMGGKSENIAFDTIFEELKQKMGD